MSDNMTGSGPMIRPVFFIGAVVCVAVLIGLFPCTCGPHELGPRSACSSNLHQFDIAMVAYCYPPVTNYPTSINQLPSSDIGPGQFVCPGSGNQPGDLTNVMEWMDYIYVAGLNPSTPAGTPILICPPEHHKGKGGCILDSDHSTKWYSSPVIDGIISNLLSPTSTYHVIVSKRLTEQSKGKYRSKL